LFPLIVWLLELLLLVRLLIGVVGGCLYVVTRCWLLLLPLLLLLLLGTFLGVPVVDLLRYVLPLMTFVEFLLLVSVVTFYVTPLIAVLIVVALPLFCWFAVVGRLFVVVVVVPTFRCCCCYVGYCYSDVGLLRRTALFR